jgi:hypothetical protein
MSEFEDRQLNVSKLAMVSNRVERAAGHNPTSNGHAVDPDKRKGEAQCLWIS